MSKKLFNGYYIHPVASCPKCGQGVYMQGGAGDGFLKCCDISTGKHPYRSDVMKDWRILCKKFGKQGKALYYQMGNSDIIKQVFIKGK